MRLSYVGSIVFALVGAAATCTSAAFDAPHTLHRARAAQPHLSQSHRAVGRRAAARPTHPTASSKASRSTLARFTHSRAGRIAPARTRRTQPVSRAALRRASLRPRHHYYERFTSSSFASGDIFAGDIDRQR